MGSVANKLSTRTKKPERPAENFIFGKMAPQAPDLEGAVLGALMLEPKSLEKVFPILKMDDFYSDANQRVYNAICQLVISGNLRVDFMTVCEWLRKNSELEMVGGPYYVTSLTRDVVSSAHIEEHSMIVKQKSLLRATIRICGEAIGDAFENSSDCFELLSKTTLALSELEDGIRARKITTIGDAMAAAIEKIAEAGQSDDEMIGIRTGFHEFDGITAGLTEPDLIVLAGGPGEGKSTFGLQMADQMAANGTPVAFFSLEMENRQLMWKMISAVLNIDIKSVRRGRLSGDQWETVNKTANDSRNKPFYLYDQGGLSIFDLRAILRSLKSKYGIKAAFIDYLQLLTTEGGNRNFGIREQEINYISKQLKEAAKELGIVIIALSQLNRLEKGAKRTYKLSDLRESGSIEQDADGVIFVWRPMYHGIPKFSLDYHNEIHFTDEDTIILISKWRLGATGFFRMLFKGFANKFVRYEAPLFYSGTITNESKQITSNDNVVIPEGDDDMPF